VLDSCVRQWSDRTKPSMVFEGVDSLAKHKVCSTSIEAIGAAPAPQPDVAIDGTNLYQEGA